VVGGVGIAIFATHLFSMTRTVVNVAVRVERRSGVFQGFLFDVFALAVAGLLAVAVSAGILALVTLGSPALRSAVALPLIGIRWARAVGLPLMYAAMFGCSSSCTGPFPGPASRRAPPRSARWVYSAYVGDFGV
jgi:uncharacterized BrkB/YihY/UPF0761 family membrane protein